MSAAFVGAFLCATWLAGGVVAKTTQPGGLSRTFPAAPVKPLVIRIAVGTVDIRGEDRADISVHVETEAGRAVPASVDESDARIVVSAVGAVDEGPRPSVRVTVRAPRATPIEFVEVAEGGVTLTSWRGSAQVKVERGSIEGDDLAGILRFETTTGSINLRGVTLPRDGLLRCRTLTGDVNVALAEAPEDARVLLMTMKGSVKSDLPVSDRDGFGGRLKEGTLGNGQPLLSIDAVRGDLTVTVAR